MKNIFPLLPVLLLLPAVAPAEIYRCINADRSVTYSDEVCGESAQSISRARLEAITLPNPPVPENPADTMTANEQSPIPQGKDLSQLSPLEHAQFITEEKSRINKRYDQLRSLVESITRDVNLIQELETNRWKALSLTDIVPDAKDINRRIDAQIQALNPPFGAKPDAVYASRRIDLEAKRDTLLYRLMADLQAPVPATSHTTTDSPMHSIPPASSSSTLPSQ